jgi:hypothetical protein
MKSSHVVRGITILGVVALAAFAQEVPPEHHSGAPDQSIGRSTGVAGLVTDRGVNGDITVREHGPGLSATFGSDGPTRDNPAGELRATVGATFPTGKDDAPTPREAPVANPPLNVEKAVEKPAEKVNDSSNGGNNEGSNNDNSDHDFDHGGFAGGDSFGSNTA